MENYGIQRYHRQLVDTALEMLLGQGWSLNCVKVPADEVFIDNIRHFDGGGLQILLPKNYSVMVYTPEQIPVNVLIKYARCELCHKVYYRVEGIFSLEGVLLYDYR